MAADGVWRRRPWLPWLLWLTATLAAVIPASVLDLQISQEHASPDCGWCAALERFGELPVYGSASLAALAMLLMSPCWLDPSSAFQSFCTRHDARGSAAADVGITMALAGSLCYYSGSTLHKATQVSVPAAGVVAVLCLLVFGGGASSRLGPDGRRSLSQRLQPWRPLAGLLLGLAVSTELLMGSLKLLWGRARPRQIFAGSSSVGSGQWLDFPTDKHCTNHIPPGEFSCNFTEFWDPQGPRHGLYSFPSGHSHAGWLTLPVAFLWPSLPPFAIVAAERPHDESSTYGVYLPRPETVWAV